MAFWAFSFAHRTHMADNNRLELIIDAVENTGEATAKARANFKSIEEQARQSAAEINRVYAANEAELGRTLAKQVRTLQERTALTGTSGIEQVLLKRELAINRAAGDQAKIDKIIAGSNKLIEAHLGLANAGSKVDFTRSAQAASKGVASTLAALERETANAGRTAMERLFSRRESVMSRLSGMGAGEEEIQKAKGLFERLIEVQKKADQASSGHSGGNQVFRRGLLAGKDAMEGSSRGMWIEIADMFVGTSGTGGLLQGAIPKIAEATGLPSAAVIGVGAMAATLAAVGVAGLSAMHSLAEYGREVENVHLRTGIAATNVEQFAFAAKMSGQNVNIFEKIMRGLSQAENDTSAEGVKARATLASMGVSFRDAATGELKPTEQVLIEISNALNKIPEGAQRNAAAMDIFKRVGIEAIPVMAKLSENVQRAKQLGFGASEEELKRWEDYERKLTEASAIFSHFVRMVKEPLAATVVFLFQDSHGRPLNPEDLKRMGVSNFGGYGPSTDTKTGDDFRKDFGIQGEDSATKDRKTYLDYLGKVDKRKQTDEEIRAFRARQERDPAFRLQEAEKALRALPEPVVNVTSHEDFAKYKAAFNRVEALKQSKDKTATNKGLEDVIAARNQGIELDQQFAEIQLQNKTREMSAALEKRKGLSTPQDIEELLGLATMEVDAKQTLEIEKRRKVVDTKTGRELDMSNDPGFKRFKAGEEELRPKRIRNEFEKILGKAAVDDEQYLKAQRDEYGKSWKEAFDRKQKVQMDLQEESIRGEYANRSRELEIAATTNDRERDLALQKLEKVNAQTLKEKLKVEDQKLAIEQSYAERSLAIQIAKLERERRKAIDDITGRANRENIPLTDSRVVADIATENQKSDQEVAAAKQATAGKEMGDFQKTQNDKTKLQIESAKTVYQNLKQQAGDLFDQMVFHTKTWGEFAKGIFKTAILTPIKDIFSSQVSAFFTRALTGEKVSFGEVGNGAGVVGKAGGILGRLGMGQPRFGERTKPVSRLDEPGHLGDVLHVGGAVPVVIQNAAQVGQAHATAASSGMGPAGSALATSFGSLILASGRGIPKIRPEGMAAGIAESKFIPESLPDSYGMPDGLGSGPSTLTDMFSKSLAGAGQFSPNGFPTMGEVAASLLDPDSLRGMLGAGRSPSLKPDTHGIRVLGPMPNQDEDKEALASLFPRAQKGFSNNWDASWALSALKRYAVDIPSDEFAQAKADYQSGKNMQALGHGFAAINPFTGIVGDMVEDSKKSAARASKDFQGGNYLDGVNHSLSTALPLLGSMLDSTTDHLSSKSVGDNAEGLGESLGLLLPLVAPSASLGGTAFGLLMKSLEPYKNGELKQDAPPSTGTVSPHGFKTLGEITSSDISSLHMGRNGSGGLLSQVGQMFGLGGGSVQGTPPFLPGGGWVQNTGTGFSGFLNRMLGGGWSHNGFLGGMNPDGSINLAGGASGGDGPGSGPSILTQMFSNSLPSSVGKSGGFLSKIGSMLGLGGGGKSGGMFGGLKSMFGLDTSGTDMGGGVGIARTGLKGNLAAISKSSGFALIGGMAALDGIRRGGALGTLEAAGGGAAVGFKFGGILGAGIGAAIGGGIALAKTFGLFGDDRKHIKKLVKEIYGMDINNAMADQIVAIAKQSFGGQHDVAVRSPQVRELLRLYAQTTGQKSAEDKFVADTVHGASLVEAGGKLQQQAIYDNGSGYAYASQFGTYQGVQTSPLPTYGSTSGGGPTHVQLVLNGQAAADVLAGQVSRVATPSFVQGQSQAALGSSIGRNSQTAMTLAPASISR
jgi:hypothetical protein